ncbi:MAG TPA: hypothetical protein VNT01_01660 [Symbiobacteriaceae bacterium]|nr:hypothetical protein [Symbiobacteriaceae bacterium]
MHNYAAGHGHPAADSSRSNWPVAMLIIRTGLFLVWQAIVAGIFALRQDPHPWQASVAWWPVSAILTNFICFGLLRFLARREGQRFWSELIHADFGREHLRKDLLALLGLVLLCGPVGMLPNLGLGQLLFGDYQVPSNMFLQPLPAAVALVALVLFPITQAFGELPTYFAYAMPRLAARWSSPWKAIVVAAFWLGAQHAALPFIPDLRFILWRLGMFLPFALLLGWAIHWRPRLLPYFMVIHALIDFPVTLMVWQASVGQ